MAVLKLQARPLVAGSAAGEALVLPEALSLWGGLDPQNGEIIDQRHPSCGENVSGRILVLPVGRGSSSASSILLEAVRAGTAPAAIITAEVDAILALGAAVARELYDESLPVAVLEEPDYGRLHSGLWLFLAEDGLLTIGD
jgi:predicted aconitase with swiveling domain